MIYEIISIFAIKTIEKNEKHYQENRNHPI